MKSIFIFLLIVISTATFYSQEIVLPDRSTFTPFGNGFISLIIDKTKDQAIIKQYDQSLRVTKTISIEVTHSIYGPGYRIYGTRLVVYSGNRKNGLNYNVYDIFLNLLYSTKLSTEQQKASIARSDNNNEKFEMADFYIRTSFFLNNGLIPADRYTEDGMLFLKFAEDLMPSPFGFYQKDKKVRTTLHRLTWAADEGNPVAFEVKWSKVIPVDNIIGYRFEFLSIQELILYVAYSGDGISRYVYYRMDYNTGEIIQGIPIPITFENGAIPTVSGSTYDSLSHRLYVFGNFQTEKKEKYKYDGYFLISVDENGRQKSITKPFPEIPEGVIPKKWGDDQLLLADHFISGGNGNIKAIATLCYVCPFAPGQGTMGDRGLQVAGIVVIEYEEKTGKCESAVFTFPAYLKNITLTAIAIDMHTTLVRIISRFTKDLENMRPVIAIDNSSKMIHVFLKNIDEMIRTQFKIGVYSYTVGKNEEMHKIAEYVDDDWEDISLIPTGSENVIVFINIKVTDLRKERKLQLLKAE
ncbi:MAG TPA: hypothetical protein VI731_07675 [Bacteroidia bacterium]|nr:hypothetical protein [Bacteroidia bacterium]